MTSLFWTNDPKILITNTDILPNSDMTIEEKNNAISRLVILLTLTGYCITGRTSLIIVGVLTLGILFALYTAQTRKNNNSRVEGFDGFDGKNNNNTKNNSSDNYELDKDASEIKNIISTSALNVSKVPLEEFNPINKKNPMGNVLLTEITDSPNRKSAPPSFNPDVYEDINAATKKQTQYLNPGIKNTDKQLYGDLGDNFKFDTEMMRNFYSTANTRVCNDQGAFAQYLYGDMPSGKSSGPDGAFARVQDNPRYNLY